MDIKNLSNNLNGKINDSGPAGKNRENSGVSRGKAEKGVSDKVSLEKYETQKNEEFFAQVELGKLNQASFEKLKAVKSKLSEYESAKQSSQDAADETEIGKVLNDSKVWEKIAQKMNSANQ